MDWLLWAEIVAGYLADVVDAAQEADAPFHVFDRLWAVTFGLFGQLVAGD